MTPEQTAAIAKTTREIGDRLEALGVPDAHEAAERLIRTMQRDGWRMHLELTDRPALTGPGAPASVARAHLATARAVVEDKRRQLQAGGAE